MTPITTTPSAFRSFFDRFALKAPEPETLPDRRADAGEDGRDEDEHRFVRRDEAFYWGWSMNAFW